MAQQKSLRLVVVVTDREQAPPSSLGFLVLTRPSRITVGWDGFIADLSGFLRGVAEESGLERRTEPQRLFEAREYRAAVISAMTLLEDKLRERMNKLPWPQTQRPLSVRSLIDQAVEQEIISLEQRNRLDAWMRKRNEVVHSSMPVGRNQASEIVNGVLDLVGRMQGN
jgi:hypothetical protein